MTTDMKRADLQDLKRADLQRELRSWGNQQRRLAANRDYLVRHSLEAGISIEEIHQSMGIARTTIDRIKKED